MGQAVSSFNSNPSNANLLASVAVALRLASLSTDDWVLVTGCDVQAAYLLYPGIRADILATIANLSYGNGSIAEAFALADVVEQVLAHCTFDPSSPGVREWALLAMRNLCEHSNDVRERIRNLGSGESVLQDEELKAEGLQVVLDHKTGTFEVQQAGNDQTG